MRTLLLCLLLAAPASAAPAATTTSRHDDTRFDTTVQFLTVPQLAHLAVTGNLSLSERISADLGGWNVLRTDTPDVLKRGGWLGTRVKLVETDAIRFDAAFRAFGYQPAEDASFQGGLGLQAATTIKALGWLDVRPDFELTWLGTAWTARAANELRFSVDDAWRISLAGGAQAWVRDGAVLVAPAVSAAGGYRARFSAFDLELAAGIAFAKDASFLTLHPMQLKPATELQPWAFASFTLVPHP